MMFEVEWCSCFSFQLPEFDLRDYRHYYPYPATWNWHLTSKIEEKVVDNSKNKVNSSREMNTDRRTAPYRPPPRSLPRSLHFLCEEDSLREIASVTLYHINYVFETRIGLRLIIIVLRNWGVEISQSNDDRTFFTNTLGLSIIKVENREHDFRASR